MLEIGKTYRTKVGGRKFTILARKNVSNNGFPFIGECTSTGLITYFNNNGETAISDSNFELECDFKRYIPVNHDGSLGTTLFVKKELIPEGEYMGFLCIQYEGSFSTVDYISAGSLY